MDDGIVYGKKRQIRCDRCGLLCSCLYQIKSGYSKNKLRLCDECLHVMFFRIMKDMETQRQAVGSFEIFKEKAEVIEVDGPEKHIECSFCKNKDNHHLFKFSPKVHVCQDCLLDCLVLMGTKIEAFVKKYNLNWWNNEI